MVIDRVDERSAAIPGASNDTHRALMNRIDEPISKEYHPIFWKEPEP
jgi:hypothetical protein